MYDFNKVICRRNTNCIKWDLFPDKLPLWVADMDFEVLPEIQEAILKRASHPIYGYSFVPEAWSEAYIGWWKRRHGLTIAKEELLYMSGVIPGILSLLRTFTKEGDTIVTLSPTYNHFFDIIEKSNRKAVESRLRLVESSEGLCYEMDYEDLAQRLSQEETKILLLCNPQNPTGNLWSKDELAKVAELCKQNNVLIIADEIHCDVTKPGRNYTPLLSVNETCREIAFVCVAPSKTFNIAGFQSAAMIVPNAELRKQARRGLQRDEVAEGNVFAYDVAIAAYTYGDAWVDEMRSYVHENRSFAEDFFAKELPKAKVISGEATYLMWVDLSEVFPNEENPGKYLMEKANVFFSEGGIYRGGGEHFIRINLACPRATLEEGLRRIKSV